MALARPRGENGRSAHAIGRGVMWLHGVTAHCLRVVARLSPVAQQARHEEAAGSSTSDMHATHRAWSLGQVLTEMTGRCGGDEGGGATVLSQRQAVDDGRRRPGGALRGGSGNGGSSDLIAPSGGS
jgi:hypothetical protein